MSDDFANCSDGTCGEYWCEVCGAYPTPAARLWRLAAKVGHVRNEGDSDATAELVVTMALDAAEDERATWLRRAEQAEASADEIATRLSELLDAVTGGRLSKPNYPVRVMVQAAEEDLQAHCDAEIERALAEDRYSAPEPPTERPGSES